MRSVVRFGVIGVAVFVLGSTAQSVAQTTTTARFAQVAVGGGYSTTFTLMNTGSTPLTGNLVLTFDNPANVTVTDLVLNQASAFSGSPITVPISSIPSGGTMFLSAEPTDPNDRNTAVGWGRVDSAGGTLGGVATFFAYQDGQLQTIAGVLSSDLVPAATIPVDDDTSQRITGYAVANPGNSPITITVKEVPADGSSATATLTPITLAAGQHAASFFYQDRNAFDHASPTFRGSAVLIGQGGATFSVVALVLVQGATGPLITVIPVFPSKAPIIN